MRIFISTGEVSGDLQGSLLITALKNQAASSGLELEIVALGGEKMAAAGATLIGNTTSIGSIGILEVFAFYIANFKNTATGDRLFKRKSARFSGVYRLCGAEYCYW